jgi:transcriptional regulator with PAS, ATPase and Fis domain
MKMVLVCWIGHADLQASSGNAKVGLGPIGQAVVTRPFDEVALLSDHPQEQLAGYVTWLKAQTGAHLAVFKEALSGPTQFGEIYEAAVRVVSETLKRSGGDCRLTFHLSPGTPAMAAVWIILAKTRFPAELIESSAQHGVRTASVPFDISAEFIPDLLRKPDRELERLSTGLPHEAPEFGDIICGSAPMKRVIAKARLVAPRSVAVLIEGESGTGKELLARAIHRASPRRDKPFLAVNCGAIPSELVEPELFGHEKGAFTGADRVRKGCFEEADGGTLFLDVIGEMPLQAQVRLLRVLQEGEVVRVGSRQAIKVAVRIIAATNRNILEEVAAGRFRSDLFYRLAVAILRLPPLRERPGDLGLLIDSLLEQINSESVSEPGYQHKKLSVAARNLLLQHSWPGNVRELMNTLLRAAIWTPGPTIGLEAMRDALIPAIPGKDEGILNPPLGDGLKLPELLTTVARHYLSRALEEAHGNKTLAASMLGLPSYQTLTNWLKRYGINL